MATEDPTYRSGDFIEGGPGLAMNPLMAKQVEDERRVLDIMATGGAGPVQSPGQWTGEAAKFTPSMINDIYENPFYTIPSLSGMEGIDQSSPGYQALRDIGADPLSLFNIIQGSQSMIDQTGGESFINFLANMYKGYGAVGGQAGGTFDAQGMVDTIFAQGGQIGKKSKNTLGTILGAGDMNTQIRTLYNMLRDVSNIGQNPLAAQGFQSAMTSALDEYGSSQISSSLDPKDTQSPVEWIRQNYANLVG